MFNKIILKAVFVLSVAFSAFAANATLIKQDLIFTSLDGFYFPPGEEVVLGTISVHTWSLGSTGYVENAWFDFVIDGVDVLTPADADAIGDPLLFGGFAAQVDMANLEAGFEFISFDVTDWYGWESQGIVDASAGFGFLEIFDYFSGDIVDYGDLRLGTASVVSEPAAAFLMLGGLIAMFARRRS